MSFHTCSTNDDSFELTFLSSTQASEIFSSLWNYICVQLHLNPSSGLSTNANVKKYNWVRTHLTITKLLQLLNCMNTRVSAISVMNVVMMNDDGRERREIKDLQSSMEEKSEEGDKRSTISILASVKIEIQATRRRPPVHSSHLQ